MDPTDYRRFVKVLATVKKRQPFELFAYCLMPNHFHILLRVDKFSVSLVMQHLLTRYACWFNARRRRLGHVFQGRFKALHCDSNVYLLQLLRYIHLNPVRAGLVEHPSQWPWSGHHDYVGNSAAGLADIGFPLAIFGDTPKAAAVRYKAFLAETNAPQSAKPPQSSDRGKEIEPVRLGAPPDLKGANLRQIAEKVCALADVEVAQLIGPSHAHGISDVRRSFILHASAHGVRPSRIAAFLQRSPSLVSKLLNAAERVKDSRYDTAAFGYNAL